MLEKVVQAGRAAWTAARKMLASRPGDLLGLDLGGGEIKLAEVVRLNGRPVLKGYSIAPVPAAAIEDGQITDPDLVAEKVREMHSIAGMAIRDIAVAAGGRSVFMREVILPAMSGEELREAIKWNLDKYVPFAADSFYYDFAVAGPGKTAMETRVLLVAAPKELIDTITAVVKKAGLRPAVIDTEPLAVYRTLDGADNSLLVDIGCHGSQVTVFQGGSPAVSRVIPIGGRRFTEIIMQAMGLETPEAENLKRRQKGLLRPLAGGESASSDLHRHLAAMVGEIAREARRTIEYYQMQNREAAIDKVFLTGGGSMLDNLPDHFAAEMGMPVVLHDPTAGIDVASSFDRQHLKVVGAQLSVAIGLALRGREG